MKTIHLLAASAASLLLAACTGEDMVMTGVRADGITVNCEEQFDDVSACTPQDGDNACETWEDGGAANVLWPPNHKLIRFSLADCAPVTDGCTPTDDGPITLTGGTRSATPSKITKITADEAVEVGQGGDGHTTDYDVAIIDDTTFDLRSERQGGGDGRVYRVHFLDTDGNAGICEFLVPHNRGPVSGAVDSGTAVTVAR
jgi:hypothetical protein